MLNKFNFYTINFSCKEINDVLMNNNAEIAQVVNEYNERAVRFNKMIKRWPGRSVAARYGFTEFELYDESIDLIDEK